MARPVLSSLIRGVRGMLSAQLFVSILAIALAGWTLTVTSGLIRERDRLRERVIQLEAVMAERGIVAPPAPAVVDAPVVAEPLYPGAIAASALMANDDEEGVLIDRPENNNEPPAPQSINFSQVLSDLFAPAPPLRLVVLHVRNENDAPQAQAIAERLRQDADVHVVVNLLAPGDARQSGYIYFDGRQNRATAELVTAFHDAARQAGVAVWSAQLRGSALPAQGQFTPDRLDITLPPLPPPPPQPVVAAPAPR